MDTKTIPCSCCGVELTVSTKCPHKLCAECKVKTKRDACRNNQRRYSAESKKRCIQCSAQLNWRNKTGFCNKCGVPKGSNHHQWNGGKTITDGRMFILVQSDDFFAPMRDHHGYVMEHRLVMARLLNRCLLPWEVVHHKDGDKTNNNLTNLELITDKRFHMVDMAVKSYIRRLEDKIKQLEAQLITLKSASDNTHSRFHGIIEK